jgi:putative ABC transport system permease protein
MMRGAGALLEAGVVGPMRHQLGRTALAIVAIALGIALGLSIYLINRTAADEISLAARSLFGLADLSVVATNEDFDEMLYPRIARMRGVSIASPKLEVRAKLADRGGAITVIGIDAFRYRGLQPAFANLLSGTDALGTTPFNPNAVFLSAAAARELNVGQGDELRLQVGLEVIAFEIAGLLPAEVFHGAVALVDIATAQWVFGRVGRLSSVDLRFASGASAADVRRKLAALASDQIRVETPGEATDDALRLSRSYRANLTALALVALFTGGFFVYSTQALAVLRRRREHAVLHALGVTRQAVACLDYAVPYSASCSEYCSLVSASMSSGAASARDTSRASLRRSMFVAQSCSRSVRSVCRSRSSARCGLRSKPLEFPPPRRSRRAMSRAVSCGFIRGRLRVCSRSRSACYSSRRLQDCRCPATYRLRCC